MSIGIVNVDRRRSTQDTTVVRLDSDAVERAIEDYARKYASIDPDIGAEVDINCSDRLPSATVTFKAEGTEVL